MKCPACANELKTVTFGKLTVDVCQQHCGGIWFDSGELQQVDEAHEGLCDTLLRVVPNQDVAIDRNKLRECPKCEGSSLEKHFVDDDYEVQVDECKKCHGVFLDAGELRTLREENRGEVERQEVIDSFHRRAPSERVKAVFTLLFK